MTNQTSSTQKDWTDLHLDFDIKNRNEKTYQQQWQDLGITYQEAKEWLALGFKPDDYKQVNSWKTHNFTPQQTSQWLAIGLDKYDDWNLASWLRHKQYTPNSIKNNLEQLKKDFTQGWVEWKYPDHSIKSLDINSQKLTGKLNLQHYPNLEELDCSVNNLTNLNLSKNNQLKAIDCHINNLTTLNFLSTLPNPERITYLNVSNNPIHQQTLDIFTPFINCEELYLEKTNFIGSLALLNQLQQLKHLDISKTKLDSDLQNLPPNLETIFAHNTPFIQAKLKIFEKDWYISAYKYQSWRKVNFLLLAEQNKLSEEEKKQLGNQLAEVKKIDCSNQNLTKQPNLSDFPNLEFLNISNNPISGSLQFLQTLSKLKYLDISNTNLNSGLECIPISCEIFKCSTKQKAKCQSLFNIFINDQGEIEFNNDGSIKDFSSKLQDYKHWKKLDFSEKEIHEWINDGFALHDYELINSFRQKSQQLNITLQQLINQESWQDIHSDFRYSLRKKWERQDIDKEQTKQWVNSGFRPNDYNHVQEWKNHNFVAEKAQSWVKAGAKIDDYKFIKWLKDTKKETPQWITNYQSDYQTLSERFKEYDLCPECQQPNTGKKWCQLCNAPRLRKKFTDWTSNNLQIDKFIQQYQLQATDSNKFLEWIPYDQLTDIEKETELKITTLELKSLYLEHEKYLQKSKFKQLTNKKKVKQIEQKITDYSIRIDKLTADTEKNIKFLAEGGFGKVYKAKWMIGNVQYWDNKNSQWHREKDNNKSYREVVLKILNNSRSNTDFLEEVANHKMIDDWFNNIVPCYGLSQHPKTGNYLIVMQYMPEGNLRQHLRKNTKKLNLSDKMNYLTNIAQGLKDIHQKNLIHRDFHSGNILKGIEHTSCLISDLGLCQLADETQEDKVFGVLPYVAPEVLQGKPYTQASDVYSFGIVAYEILSSLPPYYDQPHDTNLALKICQGLRPQFQIKIPQLLEKLINKCWDSDPTQRPTAKELEKTLRSWEQDLEKDWEGNYRTNEFTKQFQEVKEYNQLLPNHIKYPSYTIHKQAFYTSRLLPTKQITGLLQDYNLRNKTKQINKDLQKLNNLATEIHDIREKKTELDQVKQQKCNEFQEVLTSLLQKSRDLTDELNKILSTNTFTENEQISLKAIKELKTKNKNLQTELSKSQKEDESYQKLGKLKVRKEKDLEELKNVIITKNNLEKDELEDILQDQANNDHKRLERTKKRMLKVISEAEINNLCKTQMELTDLIIQLNLTKQQSKEQLTTIIYNFKNITQSIVGVTGNLEMRDFAPQTEYQTQVEQVPKYSY